MRRDPGPARLTVAAGGTALLLVAATAVPLATGAPRPTILDLVVIVGFGAAAARLAKAGRDPLAVTFGLGAAVWTLTGLATSLPEPLELPVARLALVPHALVVVALAAGLVRRRRVAVPAVLAAVAALAAGNGVQVPVLALLGSALLAAMPLGRPGTPRTQGCDGGPRGRPGPGRPAAAGRRLGPGALASVVNLLLLGIAAAAIRQVTADPMHLLDVATGATAATKWGPGWPGCWALRCCRSRSRRPGVRWTRPGTRRRTPGTRSPFATSRVSSPT